MDSARGSWLCHRHWQRSSSYSETPLREEWHAEHLLESTACHSLCCSLVSSKDRWQMISRCLISDLNCLSTLYPLLVTLDSFLLIFCYGGDPLSAAYTRLTQGHFIQTGCLLSFFFFNHSCSSLVAITFLVIILSSNFLNLLTTS